MKEYRVVNVNLIGGDIRLESRLNDLAEDGFVVKFATEKYVFLEREKVWTPAN